MEFLKIPNTVMAVAPDFHADFLTTEIFYIPADASGASESFLFFVFIIVYFITIPPLCQEIGRKTIEINAII